MSGVISFAINFIIAFFAYRRSQKRKSDGKSGAVWMIVSLLFGAFAAITLIGAIL